MQFHWMVAARRLGWSFPLARAVRLANDHGVPLVVFEALRAGYPHASDRPHAFVIAGMAERARTLTGRPGVRYVPYVEPRPGDGRVP